MLEITFQIDQKIKEPIYLQLYKFFKNEIKAGRIEKGTKLPSIRNLSKSLEISKITIENAYQQLEVEGYIESRPRSGMYVIELEENLLVSYKEENSGDMYDHEQNENFDYDFAYSKVDARSFDSKLWRKLMSQVLGDSQLDILQYGDQQGELGLRREIAEYLRSSRGVLCNARDVVITAGTQNSIELLCRLIENKDKKIAFENPGWNYARMMFERDEFKLTPISLDKNGLSVEELRRSNAKFAFVTPSHQFPTGAVMSIKRRQNLINWANETGNFIVEDDYDSEFRYSGRPIPAMQSMAREQVIYMGTFSKSLAPSLRISYMILPKTFLKKYREFKYLYEQPVAKITQCALELFIKNGHWERHIRKMRRVYSKKHELLVRTLKENLNSNYKIRDGKAGLHLLLEVDNKLQEEEIVRITRANSIKIYTASKNWSQENKEKKLMFLIGFGFIEESKIDEGAKLLATLLNSL